MNWCSEKMTNRKAKINAKPAFSLIEAMTALVILALISSSVLVVIDRCVISAADSDLRMQAFEVARENMETLLAGNSAPLSVEYGSSDKYPGIQWQTTVETFDEPVTRQQWLRGVCSAEYTDSGGEVQTVELTHWLSDLSKAEQRIIIAEKKKEQERLAQLGIEEPKPPDKGPEEPESPEEPEEPKEPDEPDDEEEPDDEGEPYCGYTIDEILTMPDEQFSRFVADCSDM
jgi:type II secretory pathway pseudopilin PulG